MDYLSHPARKKAELRHLLGTCRVLTMHQLRRLQLAEAADWLELPRVTYSCRTRVTQGHSTVDLEFVALEEEVLNYPPRDLMHWAGTAEAYLWYRYGAGQSLPESHPREKWVLVDLKGRDRGHLPDAEILRGPGRRSDAAVEFDAGYTREHQLAKLRTFAAHGYSHIIWSTTVHGRVPTMLELVTTEQAEGRLPNLRRVDVLFANIWSDDPYAPRPRCHKPNLLSRRFNAGAVAPQ